MAPSRDATIIIIDDSDSSFDKGDAVSSAAGDDTNATTRAVKNTTTTGHNTTQPNSHGSFQHSYQARDASGNSSNGRLAKKNMEVPSALHENLKVPQRRVSNEGHYTQDKEDDDSLAGMNGTEYSPPDMGEFGLSGGEENDSSDDLSDGDSSDDGFYEAHRRKKAGTKSTGALKVSVSKTGASIAQASTDATEKTSNKGLMKAPSSSPASSFSCGTPEEETPKYTSPLDIESDDDDDDFSLTAPAPTKKRKPTPGPKRTNTKPHARVEVPANDKPPAQVELPVGPTMNEQTSSLSSEARASIADVVKAPRKRKKIASKSTSRKNSKKTPKTANKLKGGERVVAEWNKEEWYWGVITAVKTKGYSILFDDNLTLDNLARTSILTIDEYTRATGRNAPAGNCQDRVDLTPIRNGGRLTPREMYVRRCQKCELCTKPDCGSCATCRANKNGGPNHERQVCLQKMCLCFSDEQKKQPAPGMLPNWTFLFKRDTLVAGNKKRMRRHVPGLFLSHPMYSKNFRSVEAAVAYVGKLTEANPNVIADFNRNIGVAVSETSVMVVEESATEASFTSEEQYSSIQDDVVAETHNSSSNSGVDHVGPLTPREMYVRRCQQCELCTKPDCGSCETCRANKHAGSNHERQVCLRKMCLCFSDEQKKQPAVGLPDGWTYMFAKAKHYSHPQGKQVLLPGLFIDNAAYQRPFRSVETAVNMVPRLKAFNPNAVADFNRHIGVGVSETDAMTLGGSETEASFASEEHPFSFPVAHGSSSNSDQNGCGECENCTKNACGKCAMCTSSPSGVSQLCFQKMCLELPPEEKAKPAVGFPRGWTFYFGEKTHNRGSYRFKPIPGLWIVSPSGGKVYRTVEAATTATSKQSGLAGGDEIARKFYSHVGLPEQLHRISAQGSSSGQAPESNQAATLDKRLKRKAPPKPTPLESVSWSLSKYRVVGSRVYCTAGGQGHWGVITEKTQVSNNENEYTVRMEDDNSLLENVDAQSVLSEFYYKQSTGLDPPPPPHILEGANDSDCAESPRNKIQRIHASPEVKTTPNSNHFLVGKKFCFAWTDLKNQEKIVYGKVVECNMNEASGELHNVKVMYDGPSRALVNLIGNECGGTVPEFQTIPPPLALGACMQYEAMSNAANETRVLQEIGRLRDSWNWISPQMCRESVVRAPDGKRLPRLTLAVRGYQLELSVEPSTIPSDCAGYGVFLSCTPFDNDEMAPFQLRAGELVDLGVYAPFRIHDKKLEAVFFIKSFLHCYKPEEWGFDTKDKRYQFDITDDVTGDIHDEAKSHVPAYVNESDEYGRVCIRAEHDAEGSVHYLLGHAHESQGVFSMPSNGEKRELFINYGDGYEKVRVRKGYGFNPEKRNHLLQVLKDEEVGDVKEMDEFAATDVEASAEFLVSLFSKEADFEAATVQRALVCAAVLQRRARSLMLDGSGCGTNGSGGGSNNHANYTSTSDVDMRKLLKLFDRLVFLLLKMLPDEGDELKQLQAGGNVEGLLEEVLKIQFSADEISRLEHDGFFE